MKCPKCGSEELKVLETRRGGYNSVVRSRLCKACGFRFRTTETPSRRDESLTEYLNRVIYEMRGDQES